MNVAILVYEGVYLLDFCGPLEIFYDAVLANNKKAFHVFLVAISKKTIKSHTGTEIIPDYTLETCPNPDVLVIPGGDLELSEKDPKMGKWILETSHKTQITLSICTGAFILASLGMLDHLKAVTWYGALGFLQIKFPKIQVQSDARITDNGKIITTAGVSAGIDGALHVVAKLINQETAIKTARYIEYVWNPL